MTAETKPTKRPTSFDVAKLAGVSRATVSHILNGQGSRFPEETRAKVLKAAGELNYQPSPAGRALVTGRSDILVILVPNTTFGSNLQDLVDNVTQRAAAHGLSVVVRFAGSNPGETLAAILRFRPVAVVDMGILGADEREVLHNSGAAVIPRIPASEDPTHDINHVIGRTMAKTLLRNGPRQLLYAALLDERLDPFGPGRFEGMKAAARHEGLPEPERIEIPLELERATTALAAVQAKDAPLAVGCYNDDVAIAVVAAGRALGLRIPEDLSVVGVDATAIGQLVSPRLTSVRIHNAPLMERIASDLASISHPAPAPPLPAVRADVSVISGETA
ncbi:LacI family DNA-binding transcriptional regulator [Arthrobacter sp. 754]|uniref:LacI family DNA-binding transcriptional regulator n=1 Tax=Arthrobacter sp. 754 TaxID=3156315 RepID=UPI0033959F51